MRHTLERLPKPDGVPACPSVDEAAGFQHRVFQFPAPGPAAEQGHACDLFQVIRELIQGFLRGFGNGLVCVAGVVRLAEADLRLGHGVGVAFVPRVAVQAALERRGGLLCSGLGVGHGLPDVGVGTGAAVMITDCRGRCAFGVVIHRRELPLRDFAVTAQRCHAAGGAPVCAGDVVHLRQLFRRDFAVFEICFLFQRRLNFLDFRPVPFRFLGLGFQLGVDSVHVLVQIFDVDKVFSIRLFQMVVFCVRHSGSTSSLMVFQVMVFAWFQVNRFAAFQVL